MDVLAYGSLEAVLQLKRESYTALEQKIEAIAINVCLLRVDHRKLADRMGETGSIRAFMRLIVTTLQQYTENMYHVLRLLKDQAEDLEDRSHRNNITSDLNHILLMLTLGRLLTAVPT
ncbi:hypothetical protein NDU88_001284 [Pleurodeles waltl]|uniref:Uncharacterized protein n=1 Tax=Pleurodeles waltl TaxID=8319 RepID=A0AAV7UTM0_PLEWA|nr:hypothetical protein NDU88_001284 [Pleurodeles waltl]